MQIKFGVNWYRLGARASARFIVRKWQDFESNEASFV
jgi:hypothetical protein